jgi:hypothetical protein
MILAYWQMSHDTEWVEKYYDILTQWTTYLIEDGLVPAEQLSTDDFAGELERKAFESRRTGVISLFPSQAPSRTRPTSP